MLSDLAKRTARRLRAGLSALEDEIPSPKPNERLIPRGENGTFIAVEPKDTPTQWLGLTGFLAGQYWLMHALEPTPSFSETALRVSLLHRRPPDSSLINECFSAQHGPMLGFLLTADERLRELALGTSDELVEHFDEHLEMFPRWPTRPGRPDRNGRVQMLPVIDAHTGRSRLTASLSPGRVRAAWATATKASSQKMARVGSSPRQPAPGK